MEQRDFRRGKREASIRLLGMDNTLAAAIHFRKSRRDTLKDSKVRQRRPPEKWIRRGSKRDEEGGQHPEPGETEKGGNRASDDNRINEEEEDKDSQSQTSNCESRHQKEIPEPQEGPSGRPEAEEKKERQRRERKKVKMTEEEKEAKEGKEGGRGCEREGPR